MIRQSLRHLALLWAVWALASCAAPPLSPQQQFTANEQNDRALSTFIKCALDNAPRVDDRLSDASTIALALTNHCGSEYDASTKAYAAAHLKSESERRAFVQRRNTTDAKIEASLPSVLQSRHERAPARN
jgi:hypothetical protein